jgi:hypothetical protein
MYDTHNKKNMILCFKFIDTQNNIKYFGQIGLTNVLNKNYTNNIEEEDDLYQHEMALKHAWIN